jgi:4,5-dihydroxyphthalate decarboxylase
MYARVMELTGADPLPYGIEPNRAVLDELLRHAVDQKILTRAPRLEDVFAPGTRDLTA